MKLGHSSLFSSIGFAALLFSASPALAWVPAVAPSLGTASPYTLLGLSAVTCTQTTVSTINGRVGTTAASITNTGCTITGPIDAPVAGSVVTDFNNAYSDLGTLNPTCDAIVPTVSTTLPAGVYCSAAATTIGAGVIFTLDGSATDVWVFKIGTGGTGDLTGNSFQVVMAGSAQACNVFWWTAQAATMTDSNFIGTILAGSAITLTRGNYLGRGLATTSATVTNEAPMTFAGCSSLPTITVRKDFIPNSVATVPVALTCTSGTATTTPLNMSEAAPAVFTVTGASLGATCTATETVPAGYTPNQTGCVGVPLGGSCTITNTLNANTSTITVNKDFIPNSVATVSVVLNCNSGTVNNSPQNVSEAAPAVFTVTGASPGATCTATETVPAGYTPNQTGCAGMQLGSSCTITNTLNENTSTITVNKDFIPHSGAPVSVALNCTSGTVNNSPQNVSEATSVVFTVTGAGLGATCTAMETVPDGYTANLAPCADVPLGGGCTIFNTAILLPSAAIPTLSLWGMIVLGALMAVLGFAAIRRPGA